MKKVTMIGIVASLAMATRAHAIEVNYPADRATVDEIWGDLNGDGIDDLVLISRETDATLNFGESDENPIWVELYVSGVVDGQLALSEATERLIPADSDQMAPAYGVETARASIENGVFTLTLHVFANVGSWWMGTETYKFRMDQRNQFNIIGFDSGLIHRSTHETNEISINFLTGKMSYTVDFEFDELPPGTEWSSADWEAEKIVGLDDFSRVRLKIAYQRLMEN